MTDSPKLSEIMLELAQTSFCPSQKAPSLDAAHAALALANAAWNRALGHDSQGYEVLLEALARANPTFWTELRSRDAEELIETMRQVKDRLYPTDRRVILICGMKGANVHVEWCEEYDYPAQSKLAAERLKRLASEFGT